MRALLGLVVVLFVYALAFTVPPADSHNTPRNITVVGDADGQGVVTDVPPAETGGAAAACGSEGADPGCNDSTAFVSIARTNDAGTAHTTQWATSSNPINTDGTSDWILEKQLDSDGFVYVARFRELSAGSTGGGTAANFDVNGLITTTSGSMGMVFVGIEEQDLSAGDCILGAVVLDTTTTRELCMCTGASGTPATGNVWTCWAVLSEAGPSD